MVGKGLLAFLPAFVAEVERGCGALLAGPANARDGWQITPVAIVSLMWREKDHVAEECSKLPITQSTGVSFLVGLT